uniref:(northern house mosquito) hypothetical protein n=1 Tax=Culex pipiens TaxID=7175 RepID=A0A8D8GZ82_CULPI
MNLNIGPKMTDSNNPRKRPRSPSCSSDEDEDSAPHPYPPEIWEAIFRHLTGLQLLRMRLVCRRWRDIVTSCPPLMAQFRIVLENMDLVDEDGDHFDNDASIDRNFDASCVLPVTTVGFRDYCIHDAIDSWWAWFGLKLTHITMFRCQLELAVLFSMLRQSPALRSLNLCGTWLLEGAELNFRLDGVEEVSLEHVRYDGEGELINLLDVLGEIFPRLKRLRVRAVKRPLNVGGLLRTVRALHGTLEGFELDEPGAVDVLRDLSMLRLRSVSIHVGPEFVWHSMARFFRVQPLIEELIVYAKDMQNEEVLCDIGRAVPKLRRLTVRDVPEISADFLNLMPNLECLKVVGSNLYAGTVAMGNSGNPRLKELCIKHCSITGFMKYLDRSPQIRSVVLGDSYLEDVEEVPSEAGPNAQLRSLEASHCSSVSPKMLEFLYQHYPMIEHVTLGFDHLYNDEVVLMTCERLKYLRKLTLECSQATEDCFKHIIDHGHSLEELKMTFNWLSDEAIEELGSTRNIRIINSNF